VWPGRGHDLAGRDLNHRGTRGSLLVGVPRRRIEGRPVSEIGAHRAEYLWRLLDDLEEFVRLETARRADVLPAAVDEHETRATIPEHDGRPGRDYRTESMTHEHGPGQGLPRPVDDRIDVGRERRLVVAMSGGVREAVAAEIRCHNATLIADPTRHR
jgi:hypothetical protein